MKQVPFYPNHEEGMRCMLAVYRSVFAYFLKRELSWEELDGLTGYTPGRAAWTVKALVAMQRMGLDIRMIEPFDYARYLDEGETYLQEYFKPEELAWYLENSNLGDIRPLIPDFLEHIAYECRRATLTDIDAMLDDGRLVFVTLNSRKLNGQEGFASHAVLVFDRDGENYIAHDPNSESPRANRRISRNLLWDAMGGDQHTQEVTGFKKRSRQHNQRLDVAVIEQIPGLSRAFAVRLIDEGKVSVNGEALTKPGHKLRESDVVVVDYDRTELDSIPQIDLPVLYEDDNCVVIDKPVGVLSHSQGKFNPEATVATWLRARLTADKDWAANGDRVGIVHRLDRATSGVMICAINQATLSWLQQQFSQRKVHKTYNAVIVGELTPAEAIIDMPIERNPKAPATFRVGANGKSAATHYKTLQTTGKYSLLELKPETGRTHQLRVHLARQGHPIVGDILYDGEPANRLYLHALSLEITLRSGERKTFVAPLPNAFTEIMR